MTSSTTTHDAQRYARCINISKRVRWEIERDVIRGRRFDYSRAFLPAGLSLVDELEFLSPTDRRRLSQVQGRTYAYLFSLVERFISAKVLDVSREHWFGDQLALEALVRMGEEEIKHQELFRQLEAQMTADMPAGYRQAADPNDVARLVMGKSTWGVLALTLHIELFVQAHYRSSIEPQADLSELWKDVFLFHWKEEAQHAVLDEIELTRENARLTPAQRDAALGDFIELVTAVDGLLQAQGGEDARYFISIAESSFTPDQVEQIAQGVLKAYRWQYIVSGAMEPRFQKVFFGMLDTVQAERVKAALAPLTYAVPRRPEVHLPMAA
ncbi:hypothetical protein WG922_19600 [Ramlibacter sp. AN1015]|uniref:hypothetical protein n=1 Tax=Ramlibacter sp. AN1015 TaxID=3133428 RepID=UPI0030C50446